MNDKYQKISTVVLVLIMLNGLVWFGTIFTWFGSIYSLLALPFVFLPLATDAQEGRQIQQDSDLV